MRRRSFLKLVGAVVLAPALPKIPSPSPYFMYRGYEFRKNYRPELHCGVIQLYTEVEIRGGWYCNAILIEPEVYDKCRDMYCDSMICAIERKKAG